MRTIPRRVLLVVLLTAGLALGWYAQLMGVLALRAAYCIHEVQHGNPTDDQRRALLTEAYDLSQRQALWFDLPLYVGLLVIVLAGTLLIYERKPVASQS